jgi:polyribonucleotide nucleotidyltransferase
MSIQRVTIAGETGRPPIILETGKIALQASGSVTVQQGDTMVLVTVCSADPRPGLDFFPLQVDYREKFSAAGKFPGGHFKREGRPNEKEILTARMTDRPLRPLFPKGFINDVQIMSGLLSADGENEPDVLSILGSSVALMVSDIPFNGPIGALRVGRVNGSFIANPSNSQMQESDLDLVYAGIEGKTIMIEGCCDELSEEELRDALLFADGIVCKQIAAQHELAALAPKTKLVPNLRLAPEGLDAALEEYLQDRLEAACTIHDKKDRQNATDALQAEAAEALKERFADPDTGSIPNFNAAFDEVVENKVRSLILDKGLRSDGRADDELRPISCEISALPRVHGSAIFSRGETQALVSTTLGSVKDAQMCDVITGSEQREKRFLLHYNFPNFSVGETGRIMGPGRREIGHGALAERSLAKMIPTEFPYTVRCVSDIMGSNGSSSMASVCGGCLALMDAGVPIKRPVAGISCGLVTDRTGDRKVYLTDILGSEDHFGDMDFKVAGTKEGITGFQLDLKIAGLDIPSMYEAMLRNKKARFQILDIMAECIAAPRTELSEHAPQITTLKINPEKIGALIGPGGRIIKGITELSGAKIDILEDGTVNIFATDGKSLKIALDEVSKVTAEAEIGKIYQGTVMTVKPFGAFVEILPGQEGLIHISELADYRVDKVEDICNVGDTVACKVTGVDDRGKIRLSRKAALAEME